MVFFDWDRSNLSSQALNTIQQAATAYKTRGGARVTATVSDDGIGFDATGSIRGIRAPNLCANESSAWGADWTSRARRGAGRGWGVRAGDRGWW